MKSKYVVYYHRNKIDNKYYSNFLLGIMNDKIGISGVDCILNLDVMGGLHV